MWGIKYGMKKKRKRKENSEWIEPELRAECTLSAPLTLEITQLIEIKQNKLNIFEKNGNETNRSVGEKSKTQKECVFLMESLMNVNLLPMAGLG